MDGGSRAKSARGRPFALSLARVSLGFLESWPMRAERALKEVECVQRQPLPQQPHQGSSLLLRDPRLLRLLLSAESRRTTTVRTASS